MKQLYRIGVCLTILAVLAGGLMFMSAKRPYHVHAQYGPTVPIGYAAGATNFTTLATSTGAAGTVTNPASNLVVQVDGGPVWCAGGQDQIPENNITLTANTTFLIVYNCSQNTVYAKIAVTAPGTPSPNQPGVPATLLFASFGEVPLATVTCGASSCGTITDSRPLGAFPIAHMLPTTTFANLPATYPNGGMLYCSTCTLTSGTTVTCVGSGTGALAVRTNGAWVCE